MPCCRFCTYAGPRRDFQEALTALPGQDAPNLSPGVLSRLTGEWEAEYQRWQLRELSARCYVFSCSLGRIAFAGHSGWTGSTFRHE